MTRYRGWAGVLAGAVVALGAAGWALAGRAPAHASTSIVLQTSGGGNTTTATFTTGSDWSLRYTFACPGSGSFRAVERGDAENGVALADDSGPAGSGTMYSHDAAGRHWLVVSTACQWTLTATGGDQLPRA